MGLKDEIIHESLKLFSLKGLLSTSLDDIISATNSSKGGFYNYFASKDELFLEVLSYAQKIWREKNLRGLDTIDSPTEKVLLLLRNYRDNYLKDSVNFPGGCIFITFSVELDDQKPHLCQEVNKGFISLKSMIKRILDQGLASGELQKGTDTEAVTEVLFTGMIGSSVLYGVDKSNTVLDKSIDALIDYLEGLRVDRH